MTQTQVKQKVRELLISAKVLQFCADIFAVFGIILFIYIYLTHWQNNPMAALRDPFFVVTMFLPFIPGAFMAFLASRKRKQIRTLLDENEKTS